MAFELKFTPNTAANTVLPIIDSSGIYSATAPINLTGYGAPNIAIANVQTATLTITTKDTAIPYVIDVFPTLPNTDDIAFDVTPAMIGYTTTIPDQILKIQYTITGILSSGTPATYSVWCLIGILNSVQCCVDNLNANAVADLTCDCTDDCNCPCPASVTKWMKAYTLLYGLRKQVCNKQAGMAAQTLLTLQNICNCN